MKRRRILFRTIFFRLSTLMKNPTRGKCHFAGGSYQEHIHWEKYFLNHGTVRPETMNCAIDSSLQWSHLPITYIHRIKFVKKTFERPRMNLSLLKKKHTFTSFKDFKKWLISYQIQTSKENSYYILLYFLFWFRTIIEYLWWNNTILYRDSA